MSTDQLHSEQLPATSAAAPQAAINSTNGATQRDRWGEDSSVLKLKGLPYTASEQQIYEFFQGFSIVSVAFVYEPDGRPSGLAFAEFATREDALQAMGQRNGEYMGDRYVKLLHVSKQEMEEQVRLGTSAIPANVNKARRQPRMQPMGDGPVPGPSGGRNGGGYLHNGGVGLLPGAAGGGQMNHSPRMMMNGPRGGPPGGGGNYLGVQPGGQQQQQHGGQGMGPMGMMMQPVPNNNMMGVGGGMPLGGPPLHSMPPHMALTYQLGNLQLGPPGARPPHPMALQGGRGPGGMGGPREHMGPGGYGLPPPRGMAPRGQMDGPPGSSGRPASGPGGSPGNSESRTTKIRGLPFRATPVDIFAFFEGYNILAESLQMGLDALGRPSGEAWLTFASAEEAARAVRERNRHYLGNRYLELSLA